MLFHFTFLYSVEPKTSKRWSFHSQCTIKMVSGAGYCTHHIRELLYRRNDYLGVPCRGFSEVRGVTFVIHNTDEHGLMIQCQNGPLKLSGTAIHECRIHRESYSKHS